MKKVTGMEALESPKVKRRGAETYSLKELHRAILVKYLRVLKKLINKGGKRK